MRQIRILIFFALTVSSFVPTKQGYGQEPFYKGKTIRVVVATSAGGGFDAYTRTIVRHMGKHVPGRPTFVVENMPGAGHLIGANHTYRVAKPDGLTLGHFQGGLFLYQLLGRQGIEFDAAKFEFIGAPVTDNRACAFTKASGITSMDRWLAAKTPVKIGGIGGGAPEGVARLVGGPTALPLPLGSGCKRTPGGRPAAP